MAAVEMTDEERRTKEFNVTWCEDNLRWLYVQPPSEEREQKIAFNRAEIARLTAELEEERMNTPGPWITKDRNDGLQNIYHAGGVTDVALCARPDDARLIAAAPDMLDALKNLVGFLNVPIIRRKIGGSVFYEEALVTALAAIAKAEGKPVITSTQEVSDAQQATL